MNVYLETLGCAKNRVDSEVMAGVLARNSFLPVSNPNEAEIIVVNTCAFLTAAVEESIERTLELARLKERGVCKKLILAGCLVQRYREKLFDEIPEIDGVIGTSDYGDILACVRQTLDDAEHKAYFVDKNPRYSLDNPLAERTLSTPRHFAYLKISEGCSNGCSFCNIPKLRGRFTSLPLPHLAGQFARLLEGGAKEINVISQDSSSYGVDLPSGPNLLELCRKLIQTSPDGDYWLRVFYSYPNRYPAELFDLMAETKQMAPYVDMPFQHISNPVLKDMNRKITRGRIEEIIGEARRKVPGISFRTTFIVGFPTETEKDFEELLNFVKLGFFHHAGVFTYSHEDNIASRRFGDPIPAAEKELRRKLLMDAQREVLHEKNKKLVGTKCPVLVEGYSDETDLLLQGRTASQAREVDGVVYINEGFANEGEFHEVEITEAHPYDLVGRIAA